MKPSIGRIVHYVLNEQDVVSLSGPRITPRDIVDGGVQISRGNPHQAGQHVPMIVCVVWPNEHGPNFDGVNGQVFLDGNDSLWITSAKEGIEPGTWHWPERNE